VLFCQAGIASAFLAAKYTFWKNTPIAAFQILDKDLKTRTLELAQVDKEYYFDHTLSEGLRLIRRDIRAAHKSDTTTSDADTESSA